MLEAKITSDAIYWTPRNDLKNQQPVAVASKVHVKCTLNKQSFLLLHVHRYSQDYAHMMIASLLMKTRAGTVGLEGLHAAHVSPSSQIDCSLVHSVSPVLPITSLTKQQCMQSGCKHLIKLPLVTLVRAYVQGPEVQVGEDGPTGHSMCKNSEANAREMVATACSSCCYLTF